MKAQFFSIDLFVALAIFILVITLVMDLWSSIRERKSSFEQIASMQMLLHDLADQLIRTKGDPSNWTAENVNSIGLVIEDRVLSQSKLLNFTEMEYNKIRQIFGISSEFYFRVTDLNDSTISINDKEIEQGRAPINATDILSVERLALLNQTPVRVYLMLWRKE